jgi:tryptophan synthase alpha chain
MTETGRSAIDRMFSESKAHNRAALLPYLTAGIPSRETSVAMFVAMSEAGADGFEVGIPYADPLMDGPVIMEAGERALRTGITVDVALEIVTEIVEATHKPVLAMTYVNPVLRVGIGAFFDKAKEAGASGLIVADLPVDEAAPFLTEAERTGVGMVLFAAPTTVGSRLRAVAAGDPVFVYGIAEVGITGERTEASRNTASLATRVREVCDRPLVFGVGISTPAHAASAAAVGDGVIVGTAIVRRVLGAATSEDAAASLSEAVSDLSEAMNR